MIHKRELSDSMIESVSSLFYLLHCSAHDRLNTMTFRSFRNIPHGLHREQHGARHRLLALCLSTSRTDCISGHKPCTFERRALPQHISHGLHRGRGFRYRPASNFASAHPARIASKVNQSDALTLELCLSTSRTDCISKIAQMQCHKSTQYAVSW